MATSTTTTTTAVIVSEDEGNTASTGSPISTTVTTSTTFDFSIFDSSSYYNATLSHPVQVGDTRLWFTNASFSGFSDQSFIVIGNSMNIDPLNFNHSVGGSEWEPS